jgi:hydrogenase expression/formation protein HypC
MCLAIPGKVLEIKGNYAKVDFGGTIRDVNISLVGAKKGGYIIVHAGFAIQVMDEAEAKETMKLWNELLESEASEQA